MKRWAALTVSIYVLGLLVLSVPVMLLLFGSWARKADAFHVRDALELFAGWGYWVWLGIMALGQAILLLVPVGIARERPMPRRKLWAPILVTGLFFGQLVLMALFSAWCVLLKDKAFDVFGVFGELSLLDARYHPLVGRLVQNAGLTPASFDYVVGMLAVTIIFWLIWALAFYWFAREDNPDAMVKRATRWLIRGSILELLVAVPSHIIVRNRNDCCAPLGTFWGITMGLSVMLMAFGPGVFFLFAERLGRLKPRS